MTPFSQKDWRWSWKKLGFSNTTIGQAGCAITCLAILTGKRPDEINEILKQGNSFAQQNLVIWSKAASVLGLEYKEGEKRLFYPCIAKVRMKNGQEHFVVFIEGNTIIDPWDGKTKSNPYIVLKWVNIRPKQIEQPSFPKFPRQVKVVVSVLNVRCQPTTKAGLCGSKQLHYGDVFTAVDKVVGQNVNGNNLWYKSSKGNFVWSGGCREV